MTYIEAVILGAIQGIAEFLPISSSGHLALIENFSGTTGSGGLSFTVLLHLATLAAVCIAYHRDVVLLIKGFFTLCAKVFTGKIHWTKKSGKNDFEYGEKLFLMLVIASLPVVPYAFLSDRIEYMSRISWLIGVLLILNGIMLYISDHIGKKTDTLEKSDYQKPFFVGLFQVLGVLPGISRSGSTITGGIVFDYKREDAVKFSFLMSIPTVLGACVLELPDFFRNIETPNLLPSLTGALVAGVVGFLSIKLLQYIAKNKGFGVFSIYCIFVGLTAIVIDTLS